MGLGLGLKFSPSQGSDAWSRQTLRPSEIVLDSQFPFTEDGEVTIRIEGQRLIIEKA